MLRQAAAGLHENYGPRHLRTIYANLHIGEMEWARGNLAEAEQIMRRCLEMRRDVIGDSHPHIPNSMSNLAWLLCDQEKYDAAEPMLREALTLYASALDPYRQRPLLAKYRLGHCLRRLGRFEEAEPFLLEAFRGWNDASPDSDLARTAREELMEFYDAWGKKDRADEYR